jgi:hypothetical protein
VRPDSVRLEPAFNPYQIVSEQRTESAAGDLTRIRFEYVLQCIRQGCTPSRQSNVQWPPLEVVSRLGPFDLDQARWRADTRRVPEATFRASPLAIAGGLFGGAALLVAAAAGLVVASRPRRAGEQVGVEEDVQRRTALDRALELVDVHSRNGTTPEGRKALERLARELLRVGRDDLAGRARQLAWSPQTRTNGDVTAFTDEVRAQTEQESKAQETTAREGTA